MSDRQPEFEEHAVVDRIEDGEHAVLLVGETEREVVVPVNRLPKGAAAGSWLKVGLEVTSLTLDPKATSAAQSRISGKLDKLRQRGSRLESD